MGDSRRDDAIGGPDREQALTKPTLIWHGKLVELAGDCNLPYSGVLEHFARRVEYEAHAINPRHESAGLQPGAHVLPLAEHEAAFINNVRAVVAGMRESILAEERARLARVLPEWLRKGGA